MNEVFGGIFVCLVIVALALAIVGLYRTVNPFATRRRGTARELIGALGWFLLFGFGVALLLPAVGTAPETARRSRCFNNLKQIGLAMYLYHKKYRSLPPAYTVDESGRPMHSWRVLLLPFLEQNAVYDRLRLDEPFDSPANRAVFESATFDDYGRTLSMPPCFRCPADRKNRTETNYVMLLGPGTISNGPNSVRLEDITDDPSNTIAVAETYGVGIRWYEPRDLRVDEMSYEINDPDHYGIASRHPGGANVGLADGSVRFLRDAIDPRIVRALTTVKGGEDVSRAPGWD